MSDQKNWSIGTPDEVYHEVRKKYAICTQRGGGLHVFFFPLPGLPAGSGVLASQGDQPKKGGIFFFFSMILICVVCSINADATLRYAPLRTLSGQKKFSTSAKMSRQTVKTAALTRILHIISRSPPLRNKKKYVRSVACRRFLV